VIGMSCASSSSKTCVTLVVLNTGFDYAKRVMRPLCACFTTCILLSCSFLLSGQ
jgi:hypothetical protein